MTLLERIKGIAEKLNIKTEATTIQAALSDIENGLSKHTKKQSKNDNREPITKFYQDK